VPGFGKRVPASTQVGNWQSAKNAPGIDLDQCNPFAADLILIFGPLIAGIDFSGARMSGRQEQCWRAANAIVIAMAALLQATSARALMQYPQVPANEDTNYIAVGGPALAPIGWVKFCKNHKLECNTTPSRSRDMVLTPKAWSDMVTVNKQANHNIIPITSLAHWGEDDHWAYPEDGKGDCVAYVLLKRRMLMQVGWPREALLITAVRDKKGDGHAVLTVKTNHGEFILDNKTAEILSWDRTGYRFLKRQSQSDPNWWVALDTTNVLGTGSKPYREARRQ
jgi:predicted transglutaminase-like cysteine proteinase